MKASDDVSVLNDPQFQKLLRRRSRWRWGLSGLLITAYLTYSMAGIYASDLLGTKFMNSSISWGIVIGYAIIALSIVLSLVYVRVIRRLCSSHTSTDSGDQ